MQNLHSTMQFYCMVYSTDDRAQRAGLYQEKAAYIFTSSVLELLLAANAEHCARLLGRYVYVDNYEVFSHCSRTNEHDELYTNT